MQTLTRWLGAAFLALSLCGHPAQAQPQLQPQQRPEPQPHAPAATADRPNRAFYAMAGVGLLPLVHVEVGAFVAPRIVVEVMTGTYIFNLLVGVGGEVHLLGEGDQPRHALTLGGHVLANPFLSVSEWIDPGAEAIGFGGDLLIGWRFLTDGGFLLRANTGVLLYRGSSGLEAGPTVFSLSAGKAF